MIGLSLVRFRRSRTVGNVLVMLAASGLIGGVACSSSKDSPNASVAAESPLQTTIRVAAGQISQQVLGAAAFDVTLDTSGLGGPIVEIRAVDASGGFVGQLTVAGTGLDSGATYLARDGSTANVATQQTNVAGYSAHTITYRANGAFLAITEEKVGGETIGSIFQTGNDVLGTTTSTSLPAYSSKGYSKLVSAWAGGNPDLPLLDATHAARDAHVVLLDSAWAYGLQTLLSGTGTTTPEDGGVASKGEAMHKSITCQGLFQTVASGVAGVACGLCATAAAALPPSAGWSAILAIPSCAACAAVLGGSLLNYLQCVYSEGTRYTQQYCADNAPAWADGTVTSDEHGCVNTCNIEKCTAYCQQSGQNGNSCLKNKCTCSPPGTGGSSGSVGSGGSGGSGGVGGFWGFGGSGGFGAFAGFGGGGGSPPCGCTGQCSTISCNGSTIHCSGPCPTGYECQFGGCVKVTVTVCNCDGTDPPGPCDTICQD